MTFARAGGILAHPTSLPGPFGCGDLGPATDGLLAYLARAGQRHWQVLPLGPTGFGHSPYAATSAFAGNPLLISPQRLVEDGLLRAGDLDAAPAFPPTRVDFAAVTPWRWRVLRTAHTRFVCQAPAALRAEYDAFCVAQRSWLEDFALFEALHVAHRGVPWVAWPAPLAARQPAALRAAAAGLAELVAFHRYTQFLFFRQWAQVRRVARSHGISIIGDLAIFLAHDSADVWAHPELFQLDARGLPTVVAGVPPDYFSPAGQRWGNPLYRWDALAATGYRWWIERVRQVCTLVDVVRLDHFRGFVAAWEIPASDASAVGGHWAPGPGAALFAAITAALGAVPLIAEDLGDITPDVRALQQRLGYPGMRVLQFAFGGDASNGHLPHHYPRQSVVYTGTHDNDTTRGWFRTCDARARAHTLAYLNTAPGKVVWAMIRAAYASVADLAIIPLQDVLELGSRARMNTPARATGNWRWRCTEAQLTPARAARLAALAALYGR